MGVQELCFISCSGCSEWSGGRYQTRVYKSKLINHHTAHRPVRVRGAAATTHNALLLWRARPHRSPHDTAEALAVERHACCAARSQPSAQGPDCEPGSLPPTPIYERLNLIFRAECDAGWPPRGFCTLAELWLWLPHGRREKTRASKHHTKASSKGVMLTGSTRGREGRAQDTSC
jgi:hypothetical protein